jgi:signal peptidase I
MRVIEVQGDSMTPTIRPNQFILTRKFKTNKIKLGQIVFFRFAEKLVVKRVFGLPGQEIFIDHGKVIIDGAVQDLIYPDPDAHLMWMVPKDHSILLGDNPSNSLDSRKIGPVPLQKIEEIAFLRLWPPKMF